CTGYTSSYNFTGYPGIWEKPTSTVFNTDDFKRINSSIDWTKVPNIPPHKTTTAGDIDQTGYSASDPDCWWSYNLCTTPKAPGLNPDVTVCPEPGTWGLTYDDGPNCSHTVFYDFLKQNKQNATMFFIGSNVASLPIEAQRALADGHHICVHTWSHQYMTTLTNEEALAELYYTVKVIKLVMGITPLCWRPPFGDVDDRIRAIAQQLNLTTIIWNLDTNDWDMTPDGKETVAQIDANFQSFVNMGTNGTFNNGGCIVLEHELDNNTMSKAVEWYPKIKAAYKHVVPIASCLNITHPYLEPNYTYPSFLEYINGGIINSTTALPTPTPSNTPTGIANIDVQSTTAASKPTQSTISASASISSYNSLISM
ncbi:2832_t:CDS:2, partial [Gigaspora rosea]